MATDPVCGKQVYEKIARAGYDYKGHIYYFCGSACKDRFVKSPNQYIKKSNCV
jgi:YHS domain-containing protein